MAHNEQIFTPKYIVEDILDRIGYIANFDGKESNIRKKHIIDNSCGNGAFLCEIVSRYIDACIHDDLGFKDIINELETYIHGIEIDYELCKETQIKLNKICKTRGIDIPQIFFDIQCKDTLICTEFNNKMDFVVGNPPYCKVHDLDEETYSKVKKYNFAQGGMTDLYLVFFEIGINMLNENGKLGYITPNSWMTSKAGTNFRKWVKDTYKLSEIVQFGSNKIFQEATTFTCITILDNSKTKSDISFKYSYWIDEEPLIGNLNTSIINDKLYLGNELTLCSLKSFLKDSTNNKIKVKNGFATLNDKLFIQSIDLGDKLTNLEHNSIRIWKASKNKLTTAIYPYDKNGKTIKFKDLSRFAQDTLDILGDILDINKTKENWHLYGRYQGIKDMSKYRIGINNLINDSISSINVKLLEPYVGIYSGLYLVIENDNLPLLKEYYQEVHDILVSYDFINYVKALGKYKNGGYYTFSSKELENYINHVFDVNKL